MPGGSVVAGDAAPICKAATILLILPPGLPKTARSHGHHPAGGLSQDREFGQNPCLT